MRTSNPALSEKTFSEFSRSLSSSQERMSIAGTVHKSLILIALLILTATWSWSSLMAQVTPAVDQWGSSIANGPVVPVWYWVAMIGTFILSLVIIFKKPTAPYLAPVYALGEGLMLGTISALFELRYPGIAFQAVMATAGTFVALLLIYQSGLIAVTENFKLGLFAATGAIALLYLLSFVLGFFGIQMPYLHDSSPMGILVSVVIVIIAALNLVLDFDFIEKGAEAGAPKYMEWYAAFGLIITLVWLYLEILRLLAKARKK